MTINQILQFPKFYEKIKQEKMPIKLAYKLSKLNEKIQKEISFYREQVQNLIDIYSEKDENNKPVLLNNGGIKIKPELQQECQSKFNELDSLEIVIDFVPFSIEDFENFDCSFDEFEGIFPFLKD